MKNKSNCSAHKQYSRQKVKKKWNQNKKICTTFVRMQSQKHYAMHRTPHPFERSRHLPQPLPHIVVHHHQVFFPQAAQQQQQHNCSKKTALHHLWSSEMAQIEPSELYYLTITPTDAPKFSDLWQKPAMEDQKRPDVRCFFARLHESVVFPSRPPSSFCRKQELLTTVNIKPTVTEPRPS